MQYDHHYIKCGFEFVRYQDLTDFDLSNVLLCRNHPEVRKWMLNSDVISKEDHLNFVEGLNSTPDRVYCAVFKKSKLIGCIYHHTITEKIFYVGHFINPKIISSGTGLYFEFIYLHYFFKFLGAKEIRAQVKTGNESMINIHRVCGFSERKVSFDGLIDYSFKDSDFEILPKDINEFIRYLIKNYSKHGN